MMGVRSVTLRAMGFRRAAQLNAARDNLPTVERGVLSPWQADTLSALVWADVLGSDSLTMVTRAEAMSCPAVVKARHVIVGQLSGLPLVAMRGADVLPDADQPSWLYRTDGAMSPWHRMAWTLDDLMFTGWSLWWVERGADGSILTAERVDIEAWKFDNDGHVLIKTIEGWEIVNSSNVILFAGPGEGLCAFAARTIRAYRRTEDAWQGRVRNPVPIIELHSNADDELLEGEAQAYVDAFSKARLDVNGAVAYTPQAIDLRVHGEADSSMFIEARNALRTDVANCTGLPTAALDGSVATASLTYVTQDGKFSELAEGLRLWLEPVQARLSQDDVVPRGQRVRFDTGDRTAVPASPTGPEVQD
jgi:hypothetical protein